VGGKVEPNELSRDAAIRELEEEAGIRAPLEHAGVLLFVTEGVEWAFHIDIYRAETFSGEVIETEEMRPKWFRTGDTCIETDLKPVPFDKMWQDDIHWLPLLLSKTPFVGRVDFEGQNENTHMRRWWFGTR
ncbi:hypothetical protein FISHEDRAFT_44853, partial [Fistulina hepatica ATCC 64428]